MEILFLKSVACLAILMLFYKLVLERLSIHHFKRYYLLLAVFISVAIPFVTFYTYVNITPTPITQGITYPTPVNTTNFETIQIPIDYTSTILWTIYGIGVLVFGVKFGLNLSRIIKNITKHEHIKSFGFTLVLVPVKTIPHTFFNYIFLNKTDYFENKIPQEVLLHEQTHAVQKHSIDIIVIELLQMVFWFNTLLFFIKRDIKLNHEYLADASVLKQGVSTKKYQYTLLNYTTGATTYSLANAINYPSLKKRFKLMKTQTSKQNVLWRTFLIAPLLALLVFSFSQTEIVEIKNPIYENENITKLSSLDSKDSSKTNILYIIEKPLQLKLNNKITSLKTLKADFIANNLNSKNLKIETESGSIKMSLFNKISDALGDSVKTLFVVPFEDDIIKTNNQNQLIVNGIACNSTSGCQFNFTKKQLLGLILGTTNDDKISEFKIKVPGFPTVFVENNRLNSKAKGYISKAAISEETIAVFNIKSGDKTYPSVLITLVKDTDETISKSPKVLKGENSSLPMPEKPVPPKVKKGELSGIPMPESPKTAAKLSGFENFLNDKDFKDAKTYYHGKEISKEDAVKLFKENGTIDMITGKDKNGNYKIELSDTKKK